MKFPRLTLVLAMLVVSGFAFAAGWNIDQMPRWEQGGLYVLPASQRANLLPANAVTRLLAGSETMDFASQTITCADSTGVSVPGAQVGDACAVGLIAAPTANASFTCFVSAADTVKIRFCPAGTAVDPASQVFRTRLISVQ